MIYQTINSRMIITQQLKSQLILVNFVLFYPNFRLRDLIFHRYFLHKFDFLHKLQYFIFRDIPAANFFSSPKKFSLHAQGHSRLSTVFQVTNNRSTLMIN